MGVWVDAFDVPLPAYPTYPRRPGMAERKAKIRLRQVRE